MIIINPKADIFLFSNTGKICIFLTGKIIEIEDNDDFLITSFLRWIYKKQPWDSDKFVEELKPNCDMGELRVAFEDFLRENILLIKQNFSTQKGKFINPFIPFKFYKNVWGVRNGEKFFFFVASGRLEAVKKTKEMALSWIDEVETGVVSGLLGGRIECLPAKINIPEIKKIKFGKGCVFIYDSSSEKYRICRKKFSKRIKNFDFWQTLNERAVGEIGIVPIVKRVLNKNGPFPLSVHTFLSCHRLSSLQDKSDDWQIGRDRELKVAKGKSIMESIERYCGRKNLNEKSLIFSSMRDLGINNCLNPLDIVAYSKLQFKKGWLKGLVDFNKDLKTNWIKVKNFKSNESKFIPECFIFYPGVEDSEKIPRFFFANSNGMAAHTTVKEAVKKAALEIIERDAILIHWINKISPNRIIFSGRHPNYFSITKRNLEMVGYQLAILDLTLDTVPVIMSIAYKESGDLGFFCGAAADTSKVNAIRKSIEELELTIWMRLGDLIGLKREIKNVKIKTIWKPSHHEMVYLQPGMNRYLEFLYKGGRTEFNESDFSVTVDVFATLENIGKEIYYIDLTSEDVRSLNLGIKVVRCIIPGLIPITFGYGYEPLAMKRIYETSLGGNFCEKDVVKNYLPHFFP